MRIWDIDPGYLNRQSLLGEHRELHGMVSIIVNKKKGYSKHPETLRWKDYLYALFKRHDLLVSEMELRGYNHRSPLTGIKKYPEYIKWPETYIDNPAGQFDILRKKYKNKDKGRIALPSNIYELWSNHKYSVMARDPSVYKKTGSMVARKEISFEDLSALLVDILREKPDPGRLKNAVLHMFGYLPDEEGFDKSTTVLLDPSTLLSVIAKKSFQHDLKYLISSTAISELKTWV